jgi:hypothetical protein
MQHLHAISENEMVASFLQTELASYRFEQTSVAIRERNGRDRTIIEHPDLTNPDDNRYRAQVLGEHRGYGRDEDVFTSMPAEVRWYRALATRNHLARARSIDYDYWTELSGGSRLAVDYEGTLMRLIRVAVAAHTLTNVANQPNRRLVDSPFHITEQWPVESECATSSRGVENLVPPIHL